MEVSPEWVSAIVAAIVAGGGMGTWIERKRTEARHALPIIRAKWSTGTGGHACTIEFVNRLSEDLYIHTIEAKSILMDRTMTEDGMGGGSATFAPIGRKASVGLTIKPQASGQTMVFVSEPSTSRWLRITMSSSAKTLRNKRVTVRASKNE